MTLTPEVLNHLIEKVEQGSGPDPDLDREIFRTLFPTSRKWNPETYTLAWTESIDAAVALTEKLLLPGWARNVGMWPRARHRPNQGEFSASKAKAELIECGPDGWHDGAIHNTVRAEASTEPRALLSATLRALLATMEKDHD